MSTPDRDTSGNGEPQDSPTGPAPQRSRRARPRRARAHKSAGDLARLIGREKVELPAEGEDGGEQTPAAPGETVTREELMMRELFRKALSGDLKAIRCLLEYMDGKPAQVIHATIKRDDEAAREPTADEMARALARALEKMDTWRKVTEQECGLSAVSSSRRSG